MVSTVKEAAVAHFGAASFEHVSDSQQLHFSALKYLLRACCTSESSTSANQDSRSPGDGAARSHQLGRDLPLQLANLPN